MLHRGRPTVSGASPRDDRRSRRWIEWLIVVAAVVALVWGAIYVVDLGQSSDPPTTTPLSGPTTTSPASTGGGDLVAYVANPFAATSRGSVLPVCLSNGHVGATIAVGGQPYWIAVSPNGKEAYVANSGWYGPTPQNTITPIDLSTGRPGNTIAAGVGPMGIAITPDGTRAYVADMGFATSQSTFTTADTVTPIDLVTGTPMAPITVGPGVGAVAVTPDGKTVLAAIDGTPTHPIGSVVPIDVATGRAGRPIPTGVAPMGIAVTPSGDRALVVDTGWTPSGHTVTPIDLRTGTAGAPIPVGQLPLNIAMTLDGSRAFVVDTRGSGDERAVGSVTVIDDATDRVLTTLQVQGNPQSVAVTPDGSTAYVTVLETSGGELLPIDTATLRPGKPIPIPETPGALVIVPDTAGICR